jgi:hypothetical protein
VEQLPSEQECIGQGTCDMCLARRVGRVVTRHHIYHPSNDYTSSIERRFRNHPDNIEDLPWCEHKLLHAKNDPPPKPSIEYMAGFLIRGGLDDKTDPLRCNKPNRL